MKIRPLKKADIASAAAIIGKNYSKRDEKYATRELEAMFDRAVGAPIYYVAEEKGKIIGLAGYIQSWMDYSIYQIFWVNVALEHQKSGVGSALIDRVIQAIKTKKDARYILLSSKLTEYYSRWGFTAIQPVAEGYSLMLLSLKK